MLKKILYSKIIIRFFRRCPHGKRYPASSSTHAIRTCSSGHHLFRPASCLRPSTRKSLRSLFPTKQPYPLTTGLFITDSKVQSNPVQPKVPSSQNDIFGVDSYCWLFWPGRTLTRYIRPRFPELDLAGLNEPYFSLQAVVHVVKPSEQNIAKNSIQ